MYRYIIAVSCFLLTASSFSQNKIKHFSADSTLFFNEMEDFLTYSRKEDGKLVMDEFSWDWYGGSFSDAQREGVYKIANLMLKKRKRAFPDFKNYLYTVSEFVNSKYQTEQSFDSWQNILVKLIKGKDKKQFTKYLVSCNDLFSDNLLYKSSANSWAANNSNYTFGFDSLPNIKFDALTLTCYSKGDSSVIRNTRGLYYPTEARWVGEGGKINWERAGFPADSVFADINQYAINLKSPKYFIRNVSFHDYFYFEEPLIGTLEEKVLAKVKVEKASYPKFNSSEKFIEIPNISEGVNYIGGFSLEGRSVKGRGTKDQKASLIFIRNDVPFVKMNAESFIIKPERIVSMNASTTIYLDEDSIYHPGLAFKFFMSDRSVSLIRNNKDITPYFNSYHQVDMSFESLNWKVDSPMIEFRNLKGGTKTDASFISSNYFNKDDYVQLMSMQTTHPLYTIKKLAEKLDTNYITNEDFAGYTLKSFSQIESMLLDLSSLGFINYDYEEKYFIVKDKLFNWVGASGGKVDYDVVGFYSNIKGRSNATLSLLNYDIQLRGINSVNVSDSQEVIIYPNKKELILKKNRDFVFSGAIQAGRFDIMGSNFFFKYDEFKIDVPNVDSLRIYAETGREDKKGRPEIRPVRTLVENITGELLIDKPFNKSGVKESHDYPILNSHKDSYVYYDKNSVQSGVYKKDDFYFHVEPFSLDSLDNFDNDQLKFKGTMISAGIFPDFEETLSLQPDHSLGFIRETPKSGFPMYAGKGTYNDTIRLSNRGLRGNGNLKYIASTTYSDDFVFFPDSMNAVAQKYTVKESAVAVEFPPVEGDNVMTRWYPNRDIMIHREITEPIAMYDMKSYMHGQTMIEPGGLSGNGIFEFEKAELESNLMKFKFKDFMSDTADFRLKDIEGVEKDALAFSTNNVNAYVTFDGRYGKFKSNGGGSHINFEPMEYICYMEEFKWYMDNDDIELSAGEAKTTDASGVKLNGAQFISVHKDQDSLSFFSSKAKYDLKRKVIYCDGVKYLNIADAIIYPDSSKLVIDKKAKMRTLNNSKIIASYISQNHTIYNSTTNVFGKKKYLASGYVDYVDEIEKKQTIYFQNVGVDSTGQTFAAAELKDTVNFTLSPNYEFYGQVKLFANNEYLQFEGYSRILHDCDLLTKDWFSFEQEINPLEIFIPIDTNTSDINGKPLFASIFLSEDSLGIHTSFLNTRKKYSRTSVLSSQGFLYYDKVKEEYKISNKDKLQEMSFGGSYLSLNTKNCKIYGEGMIDLGNETGQLKVSSAGIIEHNQLDDEAIFSMVSIFDFYFNDDALKKMSKAFQEASKLDPAKLDRPSFKKGLKELVGSSGDKLIAEVNLNGEFKKVPKELNKTIVFNDLKMKWNDDSKSYKSFGKIGLSNILNKQINKYCEGKVELIKKRSGDALTIYIEIDKNNWYFFSYTRGILQSISSNADFNSAITETKPDKRKSDVKEMKKTPYQYMYSTQRKKRDFLRKFDQ